VDASGTFDYMPSQYITFRGEFNHRAANVPYFSVRGELHRRPAPLLRSSKIFADRRSIGARFCAGFEEN